MTAVNISTVLLVIVAAIFLMENVCFGSRSQRNSSLHKDGIDESFGSGRNSQLKLKKHLVGKPMDKRAFKKIRSFSKKEINSKLFKNRSENRHETRSQSPSKPERTLELGIFMDSEAYWHLRTLYDDEQILEILLTMINQIQAIFYQDSLGEKLILTIVHLEIFKIMPDELQFHNANSYEILSKFCSYATKINPVLDENSRHWDMALLFTGHDLYTENGGIRSSATMGLSVIDGICKPQLSCVIGEFGTRTGMGKPFLTSGWMAAYIMAHEMGHNLGMLHDGFGNECDKNGFLMSASRGTHGKTEWSKCSAQVMAKQNESCLNDASIHLNPEWNHSRTAMIPGQFFDANDQCKLFLKDEEAIQDSVGAGDVCASLRCVSPKRVGHYFAGPALDGTFCSHKKWCKTGRCVQRTSQAKIRKGNWGKWTIEPCSSSCLDNSMGVIRSTRLCDNPKPINSYPCPGIGLKIQLCDQTRICSQPKSRSEFATTKCETFSQYLPQLTNVGNQMPFNPKKTWQSCAIFCRSIFGLWTTPRYDLNDLPLDTHFPDGTWCHFDGTQHYFCIQRNCVAQSGNLL